MNYFYIRTVGFLVDLVTLFSIGAVDFDLRGFDATGVAFLLNALGVPTLAAVDGTLLAGVAILYLTTGAL